MPVSNRLFLSYATEDHQLAKAWHEFVNTLSGGAWEAWYASDDEAMGGARNEWRRMISQKLSEADAIFVLLTPGANERPWVFWESGIAYGMDKPIKVITHFMDKDNAHDTLSEFQIYESKNKADVFKLINEVCFGGKATERSQTLWDSAFLAFENNLGDEQLATFSRHLFRDHWHSNDAARKMEGVWSALWTQIAPDGTETTFEEDALYVWASENRIRMVGVNTKHGIEEIARSEDSGGYYPMEGVMAGNGSIVLSYWSAANIPNCGTCILRPKGLSGTRYEGTWQGWTAKSLDDHQSFFNGKIQIHRVSREIISPEEVRRLLDEARKVSGG